MSRERLKRVFKTIIRFTAIFVAVAYLLCAGGLKLLEFLVEKHPNGEKSVEVSSRENVVRVYDNGLASLKRRLQLIRGARETLELEFFIYNVDHASRLITHELIQRAKAGVKVRVLVDFSAPVFKLRPAYAEALKRQGIDVRYYNTSAIYRFIWSQHRSHRKLLIVDGKTVLTGGRNIGDDYFDMSPRADFLDTDIEVEGSIVKQVRESFDLYWTSELSEAPPKAGEKELKRAAEFTREDPGDSLFLEDVAKRTEHLRSPTFSCPDLTFVTDYPNPGEKNRRVFPVLKKELESAKNQIVAESPYFVIRAGGLKLLSQLKENRIETTVLTNTLKSTDAAYTVAALHWHLGSLAKTGLRLWGFSAKPVSDQSNKLFADEPRWGLHSKRAVIDERTTLIGTYNVDPRSANLNSELMFVCRDNRELARYVLDSIRTRMRQSEPLIDENGEAHSFRLVKGASFAQFALYVLVFPLANLFDFLL